MSVLLDLKDSSAVAIPRLVCSSFPVPFDVAYIYRYEINCEIGKRAQRVRSDQFSHFYIKFVLIYPALVSKVFSTDIYFGKPKNSTLFGI